jgi:hypothetical protein
MKGDRHASAGSATQETGNELMQDKKTIRHLDNEI